ncbi:MAG: metallophosphoesterase [bacterium]|jgi:Icc-related predicted phosphoesterase
MKILAIADRPPRKGLKELVEKEGVDLIVTLGDLEYLQLVELNNINLPKLGVYGNHCSGNYFNDLNIKNMHLQTFEFGGLIFGGFEGSNKYKDDEYAKMYTQEQAKELLKDFPYVDVFLSHSPPKGINDEDDTAHVGFEALRTYIEEKKPKYFFHGHTYPKKGEEVTKLGDTEIIYVQGDRIVNLR